MNRRVAITGIGAVTALGPDVPTIWQALLAGKSGISRISRFDPSQLAVQIAGEIKDFQPIQRLDPKFARRSDRYCQYALWAAIDAVRDSGLDFSQEDRDRAGVIVGTGIGGIELHENDHTKFLSQGPNRVSPFLIPMMIGDMASGQISIQYGLRGPNFCTTSACASGAHGIGESFRFIQHGDADIIITGGSEAPLTPLCIAAFDSMRAISRRNDAPEKASRPFDRDRDGFVVAEGAGIIILEELEHARKRNARIYCELAGYAATGDGYHITAPLPDGAGAYRAMKMALEEAGLKPEDIDYINAHGTSTELNDAIETKAIKQLFGDRAYKIPISSSKSMLGHLLGAAGAVELIATALSIQHQQVHATINLDNPDPECDLDYVREGTRPVSIDAAISNSFGFGGHNVSLAVKRLP
jgi:3-oxoacyl-[acyl-carrier-protein] synthase II